MKVKVVIRVIGFLLILLALAMFLPLLVSLYYKQNDWIAFLKSIVITFLAGGICILITPKTKLTIRYRESCFIVAFTWILASFFGCLPYLFNGTFNSLVNAYFETMSGFTTTGASVMEVIEIHPYGILFWRAFTQWLGGIGIIILSVAIFPLLGIGGIQLFKAEAPGIIMEKVSPRIKDTAKILWLAYCVLTILEIILLYIGGMPVYDAICHAFTTVSTGGFSVKNTSIEYYHSVYFDIIIIIFMILGGINFSHYYRLMKKQFKEINNDNELKLYIGILISAVLLIITNLMLNGHYASFGNALRDSAFQVASIMTTTGFSNVNWENWPSFSQLMLVCVMFIGAMTGSTGGGIKVARIAMLLKNIYKEFFKLIHPHAVVAGSGKGISIKETTREIWAFFTLFIFTFTGSTLILSWLGLDIVTAFSSVIACLSNIGPGLHLVGTAHNYNFIPETGKWVLSFCMLVGRLELYTVFALFSLDFWKK